MVQYNLKPSISPKIYVTFGKLWPTSLWLLPTNRQRGKNIYKIIENLYN